MPSAPPLLTGAVLREALVDSVRGLHPRRLVKNPVMFTVGVGTVVVALDAAGAAFTGRPWLYPSAVAGLLLLTVQLSTLAEAIAEARGRAQASTLRATRTDTTARRLGADGGVTEVSSSELVPGDRVVVVAGQVVPSDGEVVEGAATVDESAITGESAPVVREAGTDRSGVTGGTRVLSDRIVVEVTVRPGDSFLDRMIRLVEGAERQPTPNEVALGALLAALTLVFLVVCATLPFLSAAVGAPLGATELVALFVCLIPTTIGGLLPAIGIAGMDRALRANVLAKSGKAVEVAGDVDVLLLDKTGTITVGARQATRFLPLPGVPEAVLAEAAALASLEDPTPEGRSIVDLARRGGIEPALPAGAAFEAFSARTRMSGADLPGGRKLRKGAGSAVAGFLGGELPADARRLSDEVARDGGTPLTVVDGRRVLGVVALTDVLKPGIKERFARLRAMGIRTVMITGDNPLTAAAIAAEAGVDGFLAEATPEDKLARIREEQANGVLVAMMGDGTNDAPALAQADLGLAMNAGTQAAKEAGNMVDLDSDPTKLLEVVEIGKQLLVTRGALTTFSLANDVAKYFAILPALFAGALPGLAALDVLHLHSPTTAVLSAVIVNAALIPLLVPLALRGVAVRPMPADALLTRNLALWGGTGLLTPFVLIKAVDVVLAAVGVS